MNDGPFSVGVRRRDGAEVFDLSGNIDRSAMEALDAAYAETNGDKPLVLNFEDVDYINSTGIALIVGILSKARADGRAVTAFGLSDHYREIFTITRLSDFMDIEGGEEAALAAAS